MRRITAAGDPLVANTLLSGQHAAISDMYDETRANYSRNIRDEIWRRAPPSVELPQMTWRRSLPVLLLASKGAT